jgi:hypothetical protein
VKYLTTKISLPPGPPPSAAIKDFLRLAFSKYRWFVPTRYGWFASWDQKIDPERIDYDALVSVYEEHQSLCVAARTDKDFLCIFPSTDDTRPHIGEIIWEASASYSSKASWRKAHAEQVAEVMALMRSPLAMAARDEDVERKTIRLVPSEDGVGSVQTFTVSNYSEGLAGLFWRNFFGPPFVRMFGERLATLPEDCRKPLGDDIVLVQPYELPTEAGTEQGNARERALITHLGPECFYDHEHHISPTRRPVLDHLSESLH